MKNSKNILSLIALLTLTLSFTSCKKDKEDPTISVSEPSEHSHFKWGDEVHMTADFEDDRGLKSYAVMVGDANGTHLHEFDLMESGDISGTSYHYHGHFMVPNDAPMMAWVYFTVVDEEDKSVTQKWMLHFEE